MKYVITGAAGNVARPLTEKLLAAGQDVTVIGRNAEHLKPLTGKGARAAIGEIEDVPFLKQAFAGADAAKASSIWTKAGSGFRTPRRWNGSRTS